MKSIFLLMAIVVGAPGFAQKPFEGTIIYTVQVPNEKKHSELTVQFAPSKLKIRFKEKESYDNTYVLVNIDSGKVYTVNERDKTYKTKPLQEIVKREEVKSRTIAGYATTPIDMGGRNIFLSSLLSNSSIFYYANDLYYPVPEKYIGDPVLTMIYKQRIVLGADITIGGLYDHESKEDSFSKNKIIFEAKTITPQQLDSTEFMIGADYTKEKPVDFKYDNSETTVDTVTAAPIDTATIAEPPKSLVKKKPSPAAPKKKPVTKEQAIKGKNPERANGIIIGYGNPILLVLNFEA